MAWSVYADSYDNDTDYLNGAKSVRFKLNSNKVIKHIRTWVVVLNDASFTNITAGIYYDKADETKGDLVAASTTTHLKAAVVTSNNGVRSLYFTFDEVALNGDAYYHFALHGTSSGFSPTSHIAWKTSYPDPVYEGGVTITFANLPKFPYTFLAIGDDF
jgi:hypothetical protein